MKNYYKLFEVPNDADISTLRSAFRKKAKLFHPDLFQHVSSEERIKLQKNRLPEKLSPGLLEIQEVMK